MPADAEEWLRYAEEDIAAALLLVGDPELPARMACFHAQQAAEKALKAALVVTGTPIPRVHDLLALVSLQTDEIRSRLAAVDLAVLHPWAVDARYPGDIPDISHDEARDVIEVAKKTVEAIRTTIRPIG